MAVLVTIQGIQAAQQSLTHMAQGAQAAGRSAYFVGSSLAYAYGIETGRSRGGRLARKAGGAFMLTRALQSVAPGIPGAVAQALPSGASAVDQAIRRLAFEVLSRAQALTPVRSGALRASVRVSNRVG